MLLYEWSAGWSLGIAVSHKCIIIIIISVIVILNIFIGIVESLGTQTYALWAELQANKLCLDCTVPVCFIGDQHTYMRKMLPVSVTQTFAHNFITTRISRLSRHNRF